MWVVILFPSHLTHPLRCVCARPQAQLLESRNRSGEMEGKRWREGWGAVHRRRMEERAMRARENDAGAQRAQMKTQTDLLALLAQRK